MGIPRAQIRDFRSHLRHLERIVSEHSRRCCSEVSQAQCNVLLQVNDVGECMAKELTVALNLDTSTISRTVDGLVKMKLLMRTENPADRRSNIISVTGKGKCLCDDINSDADKYFGEVLGSIPAGKLDSVLSGFEIIVRSLIETEQNDKKRTSSCCSGERDA